MAIRKIVTIPNEVLKRKARKVTNFGQEFQNLVDDLIETMRDAPGVGLAGPQIDVSSRVLVVEYNDQDDETVPPKLYVLVNPSVTRTSKETEFGIEGCLSIPDYVGEVERFTEVTIKGNNRHGQNLKIKAQGWLARIFQHEIDHLNGILFLDRAERILRIEELPQETET